MKQQGAREPQPLGVRHHETTRDERLKVIALRDEAVTGWAEIGRKLNINRRTVQNVVLPTLVPWKACGIDML